MKNPHIATQRDNVRLRVLAATGFASRFASSHFCLDVDIEIEKDDWYLKVRDLGERGESWMFNVKNRRAVDSARKRKTFIWTR